jgi:YbbR domain-containing protein
MKFLSLLKIRVHKNLWWKVFSLATAFVLWLIIINITNPTDERNFTMKLMVTGVEELAENEHAVLMNLDELDEMTVSVRISGPRLSLDQLSRSNLQASANVGAIRSAASRAEALVPIEIIIPPLSQTERLVVRHRDPSFVTVFLEEIITQSIPVRVTTTGSPREGYIVQSAESVPASVEVTGPRSVVSQVDEAVVRAAVDAAARDFGANLPIAVVDGDSQPVPNIELDIKQADISVKISRHKPVPLRLIGEGAEGLGIAAEGFVVAGISVAPEKVDIAGDTEVLGQLTEIILPLGALTDLTQTTTAIFNLTDMNLLPEGLEFTDTAASDIKVTVNIAAAAEKQVALSVSAINTTKGDSNYNVYFSDSSVTFGVKGIQEQIDALNDTDIKLNLDITEYSLGSHTIMLEAELPEGIEMSGEPPFVNVNITAGMPD